MGERLADGLWVLTSSARMQARALLSSQPALVVSVIQPAVLLVAVVLTRRPTGAAAEAAVLGVVLTSLWASTIWSAGGILRRERALGTLAAALTGVRSPWLVLGGKCLAATLLSGTATAVTAVAVAVLLGLPAAGYGAGALIVGCLVVVLSGTGLGTLLASLFLLTRHGPQLSSALMYPVFILGGMLIPPELLPLWLRWVALLFSFRWVELFLLTGGTRWGQLGVAALLGLGYLALARVAFARVLRRARDRGTIELV